MKLRCVPYEKGHIQSFRLKQIHQAEGLGMSERVDQAMLMPNSHALTVMANQEIVAVLGIFEFRPKVAEVWSVMSDAVDQHPIQFIRMSKRVCDAYYKNLGLRRLQMFVKEDEPRAIRYASHLGFEKEGVLRSFGTDGSNYMLLARVG